MVCGTGRLLLDYLGDGIDIDGVDIAPALAWYPPAEALALLEQTGFVYVRGAHDFMDQALRDDDRSFVVFVMKA